MCLHRNSPSGSFPALKECDSQPQNISIKSTNTYRFSIGDPQCAQGLCSVVGANLRLKSQPGREHALVSLSTRKVVVPSWGLTSSMVSILRSG